jgi:hypothetical protein
MSTTQPATAQVPGSNVPKFQELLTVAQELGAKDAAGKDVQVMWDLKVLEAANSGALDLTKDKHGKDVDDATKLAEAYFKGRNATVIFDHKEPKQKKLCSTTRTMIKLGGSPKYGTGEPMQTVNALVTLRQNLRKTAGKGKKLDDAHNMLLRFARAQLKLDTVISDPDELKSFCFKPESEARTVKDWFNKVLKDATALRQGKLSNCQDSDQSPQITAIINAANARLKAIATADGANKTAS